MSLSRLERETIINFNEEEETASLYTASEVVYRRMLKRGFVPVDKYTMDGRECGWTFEIPRKSIVLPRLPRQMSQEKRLSLSARGKVAIQALHAKRQREQASLHP